MTAVPPEPPEPGRTRFEDLRGAAPAETRFERPQGGQGMTRVEGPRPPADPGGTRVEAASGGSDDRRHLLPQTILAEYDYLRDIAFGAQADVIECRRRADGMSVAIKIYRDANPAIDQEAVTKLRLAKVAHVAPILDLRSAESRTWEVQEFFPLGSLDQLVSRRGGGAMPPTLVRAVVKELADAIDHIHSIEIVHRDIKPQNVLVRSEQPLDLVLADFGVAQAFVMSALGQVAGTFAYLAPEGTHGRLSRTGDWWALGVITHELLTGRHLFADPADPRRLLPEGQIHAYLAEGTYSFADVTDPRWTLLLQGLLTPDWEKRWSAGQVTSWLDGGSPTVAARKAGPNRARGGRVIFKGEAYIDPIALAAAFRANWAVACEYLAGHGLGPLFDWLHQTPIGDRADGVLGAVRAGVRPPDAALVDLQLILDPATVPVFDGTDLSSSGLSQAIAAAAEPAGQQWITRLRQGAILTTVATHLTDSRPLAVADEQLREWWRSIDELLPGLVANPELRPLADQASAAMEGRLLNAALDPAIHKRLHSDAGRVAKDRPDGLTPELQALIDDIPRKPGPADVPRAVLIVAMSTLLAQRRRDAREAKARADQAAEESRREVDRRRRAEQAATRRRNALRQARDAVRIRAVVLGLIACASGFWIHQGGSSVPATLLATARTPGVAFLAAIVIAFIADVVFPERRQSGLSRGAALMAGFIVLAQAFPWAHPGFVADYFALAAVPFVAALGYAAGSGMGALLERLPGRQPRPTSMGLRWRVIPAFAVVCGALAYLAGAAGLRPAPGWLIALPDWLESIGQFQLGSWTMRDGFGRLLVMTVAILTTLIFGARRDIGRHPQRARRLIWGSATGVGVPAVALAAPYLVQVAAAAPIAGVGAAVGGGLVLLILFALD